MIISSNINIEQSSSDIKINRCKTSEEFKDAIEEIDTSNIQFAPEGYSGTTYDKNCVFMMSKTSGTFTLDAEHMVSVAEQTNLFYIQYDSADSAAEAMKEIEEMDKDVFYVTQDKAALFNEEWLC